MFYPAFEQHRIVAHERDVRKGGRLPREPLLQVLARVSLPFEATLLQTNH